MPIFTEREIQALWQKANFISSDNEEKGFRQDQQGNWLRRVDYGKTTSEYGWHNIKTQSGQSEEWIDHYQPYHCKVTANSLPLKIEYLFKILQEPHFTAEQIDLLWQKSSVISADNELKGFRQDLTGQWIKRSLYGQEDQEYGWCAALICEQGVDAHQGPSVIVPIAYKHFTAEQVKAYQRDGEWIALTVISAATDTVTMAMGLGIIFTVSVLNI